MRKGNVVSDQPVAVKMLDGFLNAKRLDIAENGSVLRFGDVTMTIEPNKSATKDSAKICRRCHQGGRSMMPCVKACMRSCAALLLAAAALMGAGPAGAQAPHPAAASPFAGMGQSQDQPVQIEAATLEVRDKNKTATFSGNVQVVQGDTTMKCQSLVVFYGQEVGIGPEGAAAAPAAPAAKSTPGMPQNAQNIRRIEARGGVTVITKDQNASGDLGIYDLKTKTITLERQCGGQPGPERHSRRAGRGRHRNRHRSGRIRQYRSGRPRRRAAEPGPGA